MPTEWTGQERLDILNERSNCLQWTTSSQSNLCLFWQCLEGNGVGSALTMFNVEACGEGGLAPPAASCLFSGTRRLGKLLSRAKQGYPSKWQIEGRSALKAELDSDITDATKTRSRRNLCILKSCTDAGTWGKSSAFRRNIDSQFPRVQLASEDPKQSNTFVN